GYVPVTGGRTASPVHADRTWETSDTSFSGSRSPTRTSTAPSGTTQFRWSRTISCVVGTERDSWDTGSPRKRDRKSTRLNSSHVSISYAVFCLKKKKKHTYQIKTKFKHRFRTHHD